MDDEADLAAFAMHNDLVDRRPQNALLYRRARGRMFPCQSDILAEPRKRLLFARPQRRRGSRTELCLNLLMALRIKRRRVWLAGRGKVPLPRCRL